jgi:RimJ/RimL family protein N-acetyltransferase
MTLNFPVPPKIDDEVLSAISRLPLKPEAVSITGRYISLKPTDLERDAERLYAISNGQPATLGDHSIEAYDPDERIWRYLFNGPFASLDEFLAYMKPQINASNGLCYTVFDLKTGEAVGVINYMNNFPDHLKIELGSIWYSPLVQRSHANTEATYLLLKHAFELGYRRLEWKCNSLNERSRRAALRMGFQFEGIQEAHMIVKGSNRDTAWFRILDHEWPDVKLKLEALLDY